MDELLVRQSVTETGRLLLKEGLVARTWGNVSARVDEDHFLITPSGLDYNATTDEDLAYCTISDGQWSGPRKPSSEIGIHHDAYEMFEDAGFVIHTHQIYASAIAVYGFNYLELSDEEDEILGHIAIAEYGLPGTSKLKKAVQKAYETGAHTVFMSCHGAVIVGRDRDEAINRVRLLEKICKRNVREGRLPAWKKIDEANTEKLINAVRKFYPFADIVNSDAALRQSIDKEPIIASLDDMAQMIGRKIPYVKGDIGVIINALAKYNAIIVPKYGGIVYGEDEDDTTALKLLFEKAAVTNQHMKAYGTRKSLSLFDTLLMRYVYLNKYSKRKAGNTDE